MVVSDKVSALNDVPAVCRLAGAELLNKANLGDIFIFFMRRGNRDEKEE